MSNRAIRLDYQGPPTSSAVEDARREQERLRAQRIEDAQKKILVKYAETFRRLAE
jgi:hypothetical protein